ncbi:MAG: DUF6089 family protein [Bacteroidota bacterium]|nr:DUF6089 family protein [Bacteroidota bacterium]
MKNGLLLLLFLCFNLLSQAQKTELGIQLGAGTYYGDLAPSVSFNETHPAGGIFIRRNLNNTWAFKTELNRYTVSGNDNNFAYNAARNLSFQSHINEAAMLIEFNYLKYGPYVLDKKYTSYVYVGVAGFQYNPQAQLRGVWYDLSDYRTEGVSYSKLAMAIPFGIGFKYMASKKFAFECQVGFRRTFTDYLDDVSTVYPDVVARFEQSGLIGATLTDRSIEKEGIPSYKLGYKRGDPNTKDWYMSFTIGCAMRLNTRSKCARFF